MRTSTEQVCPAVPPPAAFPLPRPWTGAPIVNARATAENDASCDAPPLCANDVDIAHAHRARALAGMIAAAIRSACAIARRVYERHRQRRLARVTYDELRHLDDRALHDLGFDRSELTSVAAGAAYRTDHTRLRMT
jgi:uncharacterized protein YjiS (DUF1127 family)